MDENTLGALNMQLALVDPGADPPAASTEEFPALSNLFLWPLSDLRIRKREGDLLPTQKPMTRMGIGIQTQVYPDQRWSFWDMVNKNRSHVTMADDDEDTVDGEEEEEVTVDFNCPDLDLQLAKRFKEKIVKEWQNTVVIKPFDDELPYASLYNRLLKMWPFLRGFNMMDMENGFYLIHFQTQDDDVRVLTGGPYVVGARYLHVQPCYLGFHESKAEITSTIASIRLPGMPVYLYHKKVLHTIGRIVGKVIKVDQQTASLTRGKYARLAVLVDLTKPLRVRFTIDGREQRVVYEGLPNICFH